MFLATLYRNCRGFLRTRALTLRGAELGPGAKIGRGVLVKRGVAHDRRGTIVAGPLVGLEQGVILNAHGGSIRLGTRVYVGPYTVVYGHGGVTIGDECLIASHCQILSSNHAVPPFGTAIRTQPDVLLPTRLGRDVWLGAGVTVLGGVSIGDGCIVGAGAVVTKDLPPGAIAYGTPAQIRGFRPDAPAAPPA